MTAILGKLWINVWMRRLRCFHGLRAKAAKLLSITRFLSYACRLCGALGECG